MTKDLQEHLRCCIFTDTMENLCKSLNEIGPYVSGLTTCDPLSVARVKYYTIVRARTDAYHQFSIPKKSGGERIINAPDGELKDIMLTLAFILSNLYVPTPEAMAFIQGRSIVNNARQHLRQNYVLNLDLSDFFPSITATMVERNLVKMGVSAFVARDMATICTYPLLKDQRVLNVLPQGAPTSPVLSNICSMTLDNRLLGLARRFHVTYTRYADDLTFSSNHNVYQVNGEFMTELHRIIRECGFTINPKKTRLQKRGSSQEVTGLIVSDKPNVNRKYVKNLRALIHHIKCHSSPSFHDVNVARGKLNFLRMLKGANDSTYISLRIKLNLAVKGKHFIKHDQKQPSRQMDASSN